MTFDILKSWDPHAARLLDTLRAEFRMAAREVAGEKPESACDRAQSLEGIRRDFNKILYTQFKTPADFEAYIEKARASNSHDLDSVAGREAAAIHELRQKMPYGDVETSSGVLFAQNNGVKSEIYNFSALLGRLIPDLAERRQVAVATLSERTNNAFNVCFVATRKNTVRDHADEMGQEFWRGKERSIFGKKPLNVFRFVPPEESALEGVPDRLVQVVEKGKILQDPIVFDAIPRSLDKAWSHLGPHLDYRGNGGVRQSVPPTSYAAAHRAYRDFMFSL